MNCLKVICSIPFIRKLVSWIFTPGNKRLPKKCFGLTFRNPIGLGAGFDKNACYLDELDSLGFGFVEIGTVTPQPQAGNDLPRLFRLPKDKALINRMGFNNEGVKVIAERLHKWSIKKHQGGVTTRLIIGGNIGKNKITPNEHAWKDYEICFKELHPYVDYFVVNVSSPNTPGLRELQEKESLRKILMHLEMINNGKAQSKPILLKIAPDLTREQIDDVVDLAMEIQLDGLVVANTTITRNELVTAISQLSAIGEGGLSGLPLKQKSTGLIKYIFERSGGKIPIIASGGVFTAADAKEKKEAGASLIQVWTGFIYEGPGIVNKICRRL
jgi:dihydroorotate dehydrogenase